MKVQLYVPPQGYVAQRWEEGGSMSPLGILYLAAVLEEAGIGVDVVPADVLRLNWKDVRKRIEDYGPDLVGGTTTSENRFDSFRLAQVAKSVNSEIVTVLGGPHISMAREDTLLHVPDVDIIVLGEGERTLPALVRTLERKGDLGKVPGLMFRRNGD
ncbi:MAG: cobalamin-dependent protein, partial [Acidobacteria bacterium]|nr:cobalamin-dependent protein [Acidobacteriota bacterium]